MNTTGLTNTGLGDVQHMTDQTLLASLLLLASAAIAISLAIYGVLYVAMVLDSRKGGRR